MYYIRKINKPYFYIRIKYVPYHILFPINSYILILQNFNNIPRNINLRFHDPVDMPHKL